MTHTDPTLAGLLAACLALARGHPPTPAGLAPAAGGPAGGFPPAGG